MAKSQLTILLPRAGVAFEDLQRVGVWTQDVSLSGVCFLSPWQLSERILLAQTDELSDAVAEIEVVRTRKIVDGLWEYGAEFKRFVPLTSPRTMKFVPERSPQKG